MDNVKQEHEHNLRFSRGGSSVSPSLSSVHAVILIYMEELAFYLLELKQQGASNEKIKDDLIEAMAALIENVEYSQASLNHVISTLYADLYEAKELYKKLCKKNNVTPNYLESSIKIIKGFTVTDAIIEGQKYFVKNIKQIEDSQQKLLEILLVLLKSICIYVIELQRLNINFDDAYKALLSVLSTLNFHTLSTVNLEKVIEKYTKLDHTLMQKVFEARKAAFGNFEETEISTSVRPGKAILVSGTNFKELELILQATQDKGIDVYTHGQLLAAHTFPKLKAYPNLVGHYGKGIEHYLSDFSSFKGAIYLTRLSLYKIENLYRSRIFTSDTIAPKGVTTIKNNDFEPLIESALSAEGFIESTEHESVTRGVVEKEFIQKINEVADKIETGEIKHIFLIGVSNKSEAQGKYMKEFLDLLCDECFALSFSYTNNRENVLLANVDYALPILYQALDVFLERKSFEKVKPVIFFTRCEPHTVPTLFNLKYMGIDDVYFTDCSPNIINPALTDSIREILNLKRYTNPQDDLKAIIGE